jgi:hypothetical protein
VSGFERCSSERLRCLDGNKLRTIQGLNNQTMCIHTLNRVHDSDRWNNGVNAIDERGRNGFKQLDRCKWTRRIMHEDNLDHARHSRQPGPDRLRACRPSTHDTIHDLTTGDRWVIGHQNHAIRPLSGCCQGVIDHPASSERLEELWRSESN